MSSKAYILSNLWDGIENGAAWDATVVFNRTNPLPLDKFSVFDSLSSAQEYSENNPVAYPGQVITVVDDATSAVSTYKIEVGGALSRIDNDLSTVLHIGDGLSAAPDGTVAAALGYGLKIDENKAITISELALDCGTSNNSES